AWQLEATIVPQTTYYQPGYPDEVDTDGEQLVINREFKLFVYTHEAAGWTLEAKLLAPLGGYWGHPEIDGDRLVSRVTTGSDPEKLAVLQRVAGQWVTTASVPIPLAVPEGFAHGVSLSGDVIAVPSPESNLAGTQVSQVQVFRLVGGIPQLEATI